MASFKTAREQIIRSKLAQLAMFSKNANGNMTDEESVSVGDKSGIQKCDTVSDQPCESPDANSGIHQVPVDLNDLKRQAKIFTAARKKKPEKTFVFQIIISKLGGEINSGNVVSNTVYVSELDSCFRYGIYFPKQEPNNYVMEIFIDMCQTGKDVLLPDFLQTSALISLVNQNSTTEEIIGSEEGMFFLPKLRDQGWFEMASVPLSWLQVIKDKLSFIHDNSLCIKFFITVCKSQVDVNAESPYLKQGDDVMMNCDLYNEGDSFDDDDSSSDGEMIFEDSYYFTLSDFDLCDNNPIICESDEWHLEFLGHSVKAILLFSDDKKLDIFLDYFHGVPDTLPEIALFKCRIRLLDPDKKKIIDVGENDLMFHLSGRETFHYLNNHVCSVDTRQFSDMGCVKDGEVLFRFDFLLLD